MGSAIVVEKFGSKADDEDSAQSVELEPFGGLPRDISW